jgi:hypothetical protein
MFMNFNFFKSYNVEDCDRAKQAAHDNIIPCRNDALCKPG